ncbi:purine-nucleoside phosphorylase [Feifania hominis]|uniref:Purine nucleoside phosphorylase DeoD-type n=1 Tax=Feifania hominis TaxID=2763660 RepID=A0A926DEH4_9FIRM|nr:purine-nucleoside phosphorylase [Feifania hominis]MBC8536351.1 purine-nucleoside phosphorylase [Feifania hominis]
MSQVPTPHIGAPEGAFAPTVLMPGDPLRAKFIAERFLDEPQLVTSVRGMLGYTGVYRGVPLSVMGSGMGCPSMGIYSYELFHFYQVENIIRIGSAGAIHPDLKLRDIVAGLAVCTDSHYSDQFGLPGTFAPAASYTLLERAVTAAREQNVELVVGSLLCSDKFYDDAAGLETWRRVGTLAVEMESAALYANAARAGKRALALCTISDRPLEGESLPSEERERSFTQMMRIALEAAIKR